MILLSLLYLLSSRRDGLLSTMEISDRLIGIGYGFVKALTDLIYLSKDSPDANELLTSYLVADTFKQKSFAFSFLLTLYLKSIYFPSSDGLVVYGSLEFILA